MEIWTPWSSQVHPMNISIKNNNVTLTRLIWASLSFWCYLVYKILTCITIWQLEIHYVLSYDIPSVIVYTKYLCLYTDNHWLCKKYIIFALPFKFLKRKTKKIKLLKIMKRNHHFTGLIFFFVSQNLGSKKK